jgi:SAM-dependent methyltransferase
MPKDQRATHHLQPTQEGTNEVDPQGHLSARVSACPVCEGTCAPAGEELAGYALFLCQRCGVRSALDALGLSVDYDQAYSGDLYPDQAIDAMRLAERKGQDASLIPTYAPFFHVLEPTSDRNRLLDVGCGGGRFCRAAAHHGWHTLGIDVSEVALEHARAVEPLEYRRIDLADVLGSFGRFDAVTAFEVVEHQREIRTFLKEIRGVLKKGGRFLCTVPAWEHPDVRHATCREWVPPVHLLFFTRSSLIAAMAVNGFRVLKTGYIWMAPQEFVNRTKWLAKRLLRNTEHPLGIWALATPADLPESER